MSQFSNQLAWAAKTARKVLAPMADPENSGTFTLAGTTYSGVVNLHTFDLPLAGGGIERIEELIIVADAAQFTALPSAAPRAAVTALGRSWWLTKVGPPGPTYHLTCIPQ